MSIDKVMLICLTVPILCCMLAAACHILRGTRTAQVLLAVAALTMTAGFAALLAWGLLK